MTKTLARRLAAVATAMLCAGAAQAAQLVVTSYDMPNGDGQANGGTWNYWDAHYTGNGATTTDGLSGSTLDSGLGKLTDGVIATSPWYEVSDSNGTGQYVGWELPDVATITFHFAAPVALDEIKLYVDNSHSGGVYAPEAVVVDGTAYDNPAWASPSAPQVIDLTGLGIASDQVTLTLRSFDPNPGFWVFLSEAQFFGTASVVPEPGNVALMLAGLSMLALAARRRRS